MSDLFGNHIVGFPTRRLNYDEYFNGWAFTSSTSQYFQSMCDSFVIGTKIVVVSRHFYFHRFLLASQVFETYHIFISLRKLSHAINIDFLRLKY